MKRIIAAGVAVSLAVAAGVRAAPGQDRPGFPTQARVWIENREADEAVPVAIIHRQDERPSRVELVGVPTMALSASTVVQTRSTAMRWEYRSIVINSTQDMAAVLQEPGSDGWEVTGVQLPASNGTTLLLKRAR
jgi:hypothetical protein